MKVKITHSILDAKGTEAIQKEWFVTTESKKQLTASRARKILKKEVEILNVWHSPSLPVLIDVGNRWRVMRSAGTPYVWNYYYIEEVNESD